jgi:hypothetical protein
MKESELSDNAKEWLEVVDYTHTEWDEGSLTFSLELDMCTDDEIALILSRLKSLSLP